MLGRNGCQFTMEDLRALRADEEPVIDEMVNELLAQEKKQAEKVKKAGKKGKK